MYQILDAQQREFIEKLAAKDKALFNPAGFLPVHSVGRLLTPFCVHRRR